MTPTPETTISTKTLNHQSNDAVVGNRITPRWEPLRVLLVEDSAIIREHLIETIATSPRVKVVGYAETESGAVDKLQEDECDVIVLDLGLAEGNGSQVLKSARSDIAYCPVVVVFTNYTNPAQRRKLMKMGADYFLSKSEDLDRLKLIVQGLAAPQGEDD